MPVLIHAPCIVVIEDAAKAVFFSKPVANATKACAFLLNQEGFNTYAAELYLFFGEPPYPVEIFYEEQAARDWLRSFS